MWLWQPEAFLSSREARADFFEFCERHRIGVLFVQIAVGPGEPRRLDRAGDWKPFLAEAHRRQFRVHALDGDPRYARRAKHAAALSIVDAVIAYNASAAPAERFDGMHFDNEPHALLEWNDPGQRQRILAEYLELNAEAAAKARAGGLQYGVDIPFWWGAPDSESGEPIGITTFRGVRVVASDPLLAMVDNIGLMDYRNTAAGPDGMIANARDTLRAAERIARARVFVGVETSVESGDYWFLAGVPRAPLRAAIAARSPVAVLLDEHRARIVDDGTAIRVGIKASAGTGGRLVEVARAFGLTAGNDAAAAAGADAMRQQGEWRDVEPRPITAPDRSTFAGIAATYVTPAKITFAGRSSNDMERELADAERDFTAYRAYAGIAIHDYASYRKIADGAK
jgi:hypothetical protein